MVATASRVPPNFRKVITAAAGGNVIEWYDFYFFGSLPRSCRSSSSKRATPSPRCSARSRCSPPGSGPAIGRLRVRLAGRPRRPQVHLHSDARRHGARHRRHRLIRPRPDRPLRRGHPVLSAHAPGALPGRLVWRRHHLCRRARAGRARGYSTGWLQTSPTLGIVVSLIVIIATAATSAKPCQRLGLAHPFCAPSCWCSSACT